MEVSLERLKELEGMLDQIDRLWNEYQSSVLKTFEVWQDLKGILLSKIAELQGLIDYCKEKLKELDVKMKIGLIDEDEANKLKDEIKTTLDRATESLAKFEEWLSTFNRRIENHLRIVLSQVYAPEAEEIKARLSKIEELYKEGKISESLYNRLKSIIEALRTYTR